MRAFSLPAYARRVLADIAQQRSERVLCCRPVDFQRCTGLGWMTVVSLKVAVMVLMRLSIPR